MELTRRAGSRPLPAAGPYRIESWAPDSVTLVANDRWWQHGPEGARSCCDGHGPGPGGPGLDGRHAGRDRDGPNVAGLGGAAKRRSDYRVGASFLADSGAEPRARRCSPIRRCATAFAACVPRERIVSEVVLPRYPDAEVLDSRFLMPFQSGYDDRVAQQPALTGSAARGTIRVGSDGSTAQQAVISLIAKACRAAGFTSTRPRVRVPSAGRRTGERRTTPRWSRCLDSPQVTSRRHRYVTGAAANYGGYQSNEVDDLLYTLSTTPTARRNRRPSSRSRRCSGATCRRSRCFAHPTIAGLARRPPGVELNPSARRADVEPGGLGLSDGPRQRRRASAAPPPARARWRPA